jgi:uncharacterized phage protein (TIGR01671 family)
MREYLFRGKTEYGKWVEGYYYKAKYYRCDMELCDFITIPYPKEEGRRSDHIIVIPETVGQFTGLTDKNGKKIFDCDIVKFNNQVGTIINEYGSCGIGIDECINYKRLEVYVEDKTHNFYSGVYNDNFISLWEIGWNCNAIDGKIKELEVIGNIHDNPELFNDT